MAYCGPRGIPLDTFLNWPEYSQHAALEWAGYESRRCQGCGSHPDEPRRHPHIDTCSGCIAMKAAAEEAREIPGAHARLVPGAQTDCPRCQLEAEANAAGGGGRERPEPGRPRPHPHGG